ncbi:MAG: cell surface protein, partial [Clostridiales bacterium]|nr:cell surface protein [Clostridiales bacterium]
MSVMMGQASIDENGNIAGGVAGDQTKKEVATKAWYSKPWGFMAIYPDEKIREKIAAAVQAACDNDKIGYDQNQRNT